MLKKFATIYWKGRKNWDFSTIAAWFNYRPIFWGWFVGHSVSMISHKKYFSIWICIISDNSTASLLTISKSVIFIPFSKNCLKCLVLNLRFYFAFNLLICQWQIFVKNCNDFNSTKVWTKILNSVSFSIFNCFSTFALENNPSLNQ